MGELRVSMFWNGNDHFPCLKSRAAETKHLAGALLYAFGKLRDPANEQHQWVYRLMQLIVRLEVIIEDNKMNYVLQPDVAEEWKKCCQGVVQMEARLGQHYHPKKITLFHFTIKFHYLCHLALLGKGLNPRLAWCYSGEKMMQVTKQIVQASHLGSPPWLVSSKSILKYARGLSLHCVDNVWKR